MIIRNKLVWKKSADLIEQSINELLEEQDYVVLGVVGGRSVSGIFEHLRRRELPWYKIHLFMIDERKVPLFHKDSNFKIVEDHIADMFPEENLHPFRIEEGIDKYEEELKNYSGHYDILLLSSGEDGHIAALYPNHSVLDDSEFFIEMDDSPKLPKKRMTASRKLLLKSKIAILVFAGETKRNALDMFLDESITYKDCPAKLVKELKYYVITDLR